MPITFTFRIKQSPVVATDTVVCTSCSITCAYWNVLITTKCNNWSDVCHCWYMYMYVRLFTTPPSLWHWNGMHHWSLHAIVNFGGDTQCQSLCVLFDCWTWYKGWSCGSSSQASENERWSITMYSCVGLILCMCELAALTEWRRLASFFHSSQGSWWGYLLFTDGIGKH